MMDYEKNIANNHGAPDSWCPLPWSHISIKGNGVYRLCCHSHVSKTGGILKNDAGKPFHISHSDWKTVINSKTMKSIRKHMLKGKWPEECIRCKREYKSNMTSRNTYERNTLASLIESKNYPSYQKAKEQTNKDGSISHKNFPFSFLDIRFGNLCNLKCIMCGPTDSSQWYNDHYKLWGNHFRDSGEKVTLVPDKKGNMVTERNIYNWSDDPHLWKQIEKHFQNFRRIYIVGGEPLLIKKHYDFLEKCVEKGVAKKLTLEYNSNITWIPEKAWDIWKHFKKVIMGISLDGIGKVNDFIRYPSKWNKIERNLKLFNKAEGNFIIHVTTTVSVLNIWHLPEILKYFIKSNYKNINIWNSSSLISPHPAHKPGHLNVNILEDDFKENIKNHFHFYKNNFKDFSWQSKYGSSEKVKWANKIRQAESILDNYISYMQSIKYSKGQLNSFRSKFIHNMDQLDVLRKTDWLKTLPELYESTKSWRELPMDWKNT